MDINYKTTGFLKDVNYTSDLSDKLNGYTNKFGHKLELELKEIPYLFVENAELEIIEFLDDGKSCKIKLSFYKSCDKNGKESEKPSKIEVYRKINLTLDKAVKQYNSKF